MNPACSSLSLSISLDERIAFRVTLTREIENAGTAVLEIAAALAADGVNYRGKMTDIIFVIRPASKLFLTGNASERAHSFSVAARVIA